MADLLINDEVTTQLLGEGATPDPYAQVIILLAEADAERLAQHMIDRGDGTLLAAEAKEVATPIVQALIDAGYGVQP